MDPKTLLFEYQEPVSESSIRFGGSVLVPKTEILESFDPSDFDGGYSYLSGSKGKPRGKYKTPERK